MCARTSQPPRVWGPSSPHLLVVLGVGGWALGYVLAHYQNFALILWTIFVLFSICNNGDSQKFNLRTSIFLFVSFSVYIKVHKCWQGIICKIIYHSLHVSCTAHIDLKLTLWETFSTMICGYSTAGWLIFFQLIETRLGFAANQSQQVMHTEYAFCSRVMWNLKCVKEELIMHSSLWWL